MTTMRRLNGMRISDAGHEAAAAGPPPDIKSIVWLEYVPLKILQAKVEIALNWWWQNGKLQWLSL